MRKNRPSRRSGRNPFARLFGGRTATARKAPRRRDLERLEAREMMTASPGTNEFYENQWYLFADGQFTEFDPTSPTYFQTTAVPGEDINILDAWAQGLTGAGVQIAIIDGGFDLNHEDLVFISSGLTTDFDLLEGDTNPLYADPADSLGTALAGIIGAQDNELGVVGIAHGADLFPIRLTGGPNETIVPTIDAINSAFRFHAGFIQDGNGDGVPDAVLGGALVPIDIDGDGMADGMGQDPSLVTDVYLHTGGFNVQDGASPREALLLPNEASLITGADISILEAITDTAINGRATWFDENLDGLVTPNEIHALGSIHIVPAGNDAGRIGATPPFVVPGDLASSQYDQLANSIYTIAVGAVDYDGRYENPATGQVSGYSEGGSNVLIVAPSGNFRQDISTNQDLNSGLLTTDLTGEEGANVGPFFNFEYDGDYFADTDYASGVSGTEAAAAQVAAVVGLMLEANPRLSARDVQQILMMSARQNDQFNESWIVNQMQSFVDYDFILPSYASYNLDTDGDGEVDIEDAIIPNSEYDPLLGDFVLERGFFFDENSSVDLGVPFVYAPPTATDADENPIFFMEGGAPVLDELEYPVPRFADPNDGDILYNAAEPILDGDDNIIGWLDVNGDNANDAQVDGIDLDAGELPIVLKSIRFVNTAPEGEDDNFVEETVITLLYDPNGNLTRGTVQLLDDTGRLAVNEAGEPIYGPADGNLNLNGLTLAPPELRVAGGNAQDPVIIFQPGTVGDDRIGGFGGLLTPILSRNQLTPLLFENGAGYTVSGGYGDSLEDLSYGHGVLDAGLAVELAAAWETYDLYMDDVITVSSGILGGTALIRVQPAVNITAPNGVVILTVTGGMANAGNINPAYYEQFFTDIETEEITNADGDTVGEVITSAPFFNLDGPLPSDRGITEIPFEFDASLLEDFLSVEWLEFTTNIAAGDIDNLRIAIRAPDGTQSELNAFRPSAGPALVEQDPQGQQGRFTPSEQAIDSIIGGVPINNNDQFINDTVVNQIVGVDSPDALPAGEAWTWTTNRHWGEIFSTVAQSLEGAPGGGDAVLTDGWSLIIENHGFGEILLGGQYEFTVHGTKATGNRIQGKVGIDDNKQGISETDNDENFNFNRSVDFGIVQVQLEDADGNLFDVEQTVVLDNANDSVTYTNSNDPDADRFSLDNIYKTVAPDTGEELYYPVLDAALFNAIRTAEDPEETALGLLGPLEDFFRVTQYDDSLVITGAQLTYGVNRFTTAGDSAAVINGVNNGFYGELPTDFTADPFGFRNFDYSQESFASGVVVKATQYVTSYDIDGNLLSREATGEFQHFMTGADGNYYFDVEATPAAPVEDFFPSTGTYLAAYNAWFAEYGGQTFDYEITILNDDASRILTNGGEGYFDTPTNGSIVEFDGASSYTVQIFASSDLKFGETTKVTNVNFLLETDPALTNVPVSGTVYRDRNGDGTQQAGIDEAVAGVTVFYDANNNQVLDGDELSAVTDANGAYTFTISGLLSPQDVTIGIVDSTIPATLVKLDPLDGFQDISVSPGNGSQVDFTLQLAIGEPSVVIGTVFEDLDQDGVHDPNETALTDTGVVTAYIDLNGNGTLDSGEPSASPRADGSFLIETNETGEYTVRIATTSTLFVQTAPAAGAGISVVLVAGEQSDLPAEFGVYDKRNSDFGDLWVDATHNYPTLLADNGARHVVQQGTRLGASIDVDDDGFPRNPSIDGLGDDYSNLDDEDGVSLVTRDIQPNSTIEFDLIAIGGGAVLNAWVDFNNDGDWDDEGEHIFVNAEDLQVADPNNPVARRISAATPADVDTDAEFYVARFRWGSSGIGYAGVANRGEVEDYLFANTQPIVVSGAVRNDTDGDGVFEGSDTAIAGARIFFDRDLDGVLDADEPRAVTDATGAYRLEINTTEDTLDVTLRLDLTSIDPNLQPLVPIDGIFSQTIANSTPVTSNYLVAEPQGVSGLVFEDADNDGVFDAGEGGFGGVLVQVFADTDSNGSFETLVDSTTTNSDGSYSIAIDAVGTYSVRVDLTGLQFVTQSLPAGNGSRTATVSAGAFTTVGDFGVYDAKPTFTLDYGDLIVDATRNFPTTLAANGPRHALVGGVFLGVTPPDADPGTLQSGNATADDNLFTDDEDGVRMASSILAGSDVLIDITATGGSANRLHAWIDFNNDGDWDDAGERITSAANGTGLASGQSTRLVIDTAGIDIDPTATAYAARFRWGEGITGYTGAATSGEVEDYMLPRIRVSAGGIDPIGDFNGDDLVTRDDHAVWASTYGSTTNLAADGNGDGVVNAADYTMWRNAFNAAQVALATAPQEPDAYTYLSPLAGDPVGVPPLAQMPIEPVVFDANAFAPMLLVNPTVASALDESFALGDEGVASGDDAIDEALLEWSLGAPVADGAEETAATSNGSEVAEEAEVEEEEAFASAFVF